MACARTDQKNAALALMAQKLQVREGEIVEANQRDIADAVDRGLPDKLVRRLRFGEEKIAARRRCLEKIAALPDPVGQLIREEKLPGGLEVARVRVPLGVVMMVYEARPHVTINAGAFCIKSGNAAILRGGSEARRCNAVLGELWRESLLEAGLPAEAVQVVSGSHERIHELLALDEYIDLLIPRGGENLIRTVVEHSRIPVIKHYQGICHIYLDEGCNLQKGIAVALDSKCLMPEVCNAMETLLVSKGLLQQLPQIVAAFRKCGVVVRGCGQTRAAVADVEAATESDWATEYLDLIVAVRVVESIDEAIEHINRYGSHHTDAIVTKNKAHMERFVERVDSAVVLVNASTMLCDGESLGMGAEIGISTDKLHARGPMGLEELTSYKFVIRGSGQTMGGSMERGKGWRNDA